MEASNLKSAIEIDLINDIEKFTEYLYKVTRKRKLVLQKLGEVGNDPLYLILPNEENKELPSLLIAAGFHGEEPAGCWAILNFIETFFTRYSRKINFAFLPLVNPTGFRNRSRLNDWKEDPNRGFCHTSSGKPEPSREGRILLKQLDQLKLLGRDGFISLHEDVAQSNFYLYTFECTTSPGIFSQALRDGLKRFFNPVPDGILEKGKVRDGIIFRHCDGSFEDFLFHEGIPRTACTETPGLLDINRRIKANVSIIKRLADFTIANNVKL